ncbi:MAG: dihydrodipicolinate synthase family protein [Calditrichia bacterium]
MLSLRGIFPPIVTPFEDDEVSFNHLSDNIKKWNEFDLSGYVVLGSNGENVMLSETESLQVIETAVKYVPEGRLVIAGAGQESTRHTIDFIKKAGLTGASAALVIAPHYYKSQMKLPVLESYFREIADDSPIPVIIYNVPKFTGLEMSVDLIAALGEHPNILGMKDSSGNITYQQSILGLGLKNFQLLTGSANTLMPSLLMGAVGGILAFANIAPGLCLKLYRLVNTGKLEEARKIQIKIVKLNQLTTGIYGIGGLKFALDRIGFYGGKPRAPLPLPNEKGRNEILDELKRLNLL